MSAHINLLDPALRRRRLIVSARHVAALIVVTLIGMALVEAYLARDLARRRAERAVVQQLHETRVARMAEARRAEQQGASSALGAEIRRLESELHAQREGMSTLRSGAAGTRVGYAEYLRALSRGALHGLWLTGFTIAGSGDITLRGRLARAELLPEYIQRLSGQPVLSGRTFATLDVAQPGTEREASSSAREYLEFTLASSERQAAAAGGRSP